LQRPYLVPLIFSLGEEALYFYAMLSLLYIDPGSGSFLVQAIIAAVLGGAFIVKGYWYRLKSFFTGKDYTEKKDKTDNESDSSTEEEIEY
jgi:hypothetical protein